MDTTPSPPPFLISLQMYFRAICYDFYLRVKLHRVTISPSLQCRDANTSLLCMRVRKCVVHVCSHVHTVSGLGGWLIIWDDCGRPASEELPVTDEMRIAHCKCCRTETVTVCNTCNYRIWYILVRQGAYSVRAVVLWFDSRTNLTVRQ